MPLALTPVTPTPASGGTIAPTDDLNVHLDDPDNSTGFSGESGEVYVRFSDGVVEAVLAAAGTPLVAPYLDSTFGADPLVFHRTGGWRKSFTLIIGGRNVTAGQPAQLAELHYIVTGDAPVSMASPTVLNPVEPQSTADAFEFDVGEVNDRDLLLSMAFPPEPGEEVVFDGTAFSAPYAASEGPTDNLDGTVHFTLRRALGWPDTAQAKQLRVDAVVG